MVLPKLRKPERPRSNNTPRLSLEGNTSTGLRVSRQSGFRLTVQTPGINAAPHSLTAHKVKPDQVEAYKKVALVLFSATYS